jgi:cytochrome c556
MKYCLGLCLLAFFSNAYADNADVAARERYMKDFRSANKAIGRLLKANPPIWPHFPAKPPTCKHWPTNLGRIMLLPQPRARPKPPCGSSHNKFQAAIQRFSEAVVALNNAARQGNQAAAQSAFGQLGQSCKACHDTFRR